MSAFIVTDDTINAIVTFAIRHCGSIPKPPGHTAAGDWVSAKECDPQALATLLLVENTRSVNYRYRESDPPEPITFKATRCGATSPNVRRELGPIDIVKLSHCLAYQSCEHPEWETSWARRFLERVEREAVTKLPAYSVAPWGLY